MWVSRLCTSTVQYLCVPPVAIGPLPAHSMGVGVLKWPVWAAAPSMPALCITESASLHCIQHADFYM